MSGFLTSFPLVRHPSTLFSKFTKRGQQQSF